MWINNQNTLVFENINKLICVGGGNFTPRPPLVGFPLITQKWEKLWPWQFAVFSNIRAKFGIPYLPLSPDIGKNSGQSHIKGICHNSRTSDDIDKKIDNDVMSKNCDIIDIFLIYGQFEAIQKLDFGRIICKTYIFIK